LSKRSQCIALVLVALAARLIFVTSLATPPNMEGGDARWYLENGADLVRMSESGPIPSGPGYLALVGVIGNLLPEPAVVPAVWLVQAVLGVLTVGLVYLLGRRAWGHQVGIIAGAALALNPAFIIETGQIATETLFIVLLMAALALYAWWGEKGGTRALAGVGVLMGLATLTRAVLLAFPALLVVHLALKHGWRGALKGAGALLVAFVLTLAPWTVYNAVKWNRFVVAAEGFSSFLWLGTQEAGWQGPEQTHQAVGVTADDPTQDPDFGGKALQTIGADPVGYITLRLRRLAQSCLQPHNTVYFPGESLKAAAAHWLTEDRSVSGLVALTQGESFWPKLTLYLFHYVRLAGGLAGMVLAARRRRKGKTRGLSPLSGPLSGPSSGTLFVLYALIGYFLGVHLVLYVIPRYLFPTEPVWWLFAALTLDRAWGRLRHR
jgi:4-amino-4-deoxy-L-arabinose transferase-like glycosyltransferase